MTTAPGPRHADDIPARYEHKHLLTLRQADEVRRMIAPFCVEDEFSKRAPNGRYLITSLYLDTATLECFRQWEVGTAHRYKLRIRRYGQALGESPVFLEVKERCLDITIKKRAILRDPHAWLKTLQGPGSTARERDFIARMRRHRCEPVLLVRYQRQAWRGRTEAYARITFDSRVQFQPCSEWRPALDGDARAWVAADGPVDIDELEPRVLLEVKFERDVPRWMTHVLRSLELARRGYSKYGVGILRAFAPEERPDASRREPVF